MGIHEIIRHGRTWLIGRTWLSAAFLTATLVGAANAQTNVRFTLDSKVDGLAAPFLLGIDKGYYKAETLNITVDPAAEPAESIARVASGLYDMGIADINLLIKYRDQN